MKIVVEVEPGMTDAAVIRCLQVMARQVADDRADDPEEDTRLELSDTAGRWLRVEIVGTLREVNVTAAHTMLAVDPMPAE